MVAGATLRWMTHETLPELLGAVERHRHRLAGLLDGLEDARRAASRAGFALRGGDGADLDWLLDRFSDDLRASDHHLQALMAELGHRS